MPKFPACSGAPLYRGLMQCSFSYPAASEQTGLTVELPTSEPATSQVIYTLGAGNIPTQEGHPIPYQLAPILYAYVRNTSGSTRTISWRLIKNGSSVATGTSSAIANNYYAAISAGLAWSGGQPVSGDVIELRLWASGTTVNMSAHALAVHVTRIGYGAQTPILWAGSVSPAANYYSLEASGIRGPSVGGTSNSTEYRHYPSASTNYWNIPLAAAVPYLTTLHAQYGTGQLYMGDAYTSAAIVSVGSSVAYFQKTYSITKISFLPINVKL